jgi:hypothetical protein
MARYGMTLQLANSLDKARLTQYSVKHGFGDCLRRFLRWSTNSGRLETKCSMTRPTLSVWQIGQRNVPISSTITHILSYYAPAIVLLRSITVSTSIQQTFSSSQLASIHEEITPSSTALRWYHSNHDHQFHEFSIGGSVPLEGFASISVG